VSRTRSRAPAEYANFSLPRKKFGSRTFSFGHASASSVAMYPDRRKPPLNEARRRTLARVYPRVRQPNFSFPARRRIPDRDVPGQASTASPRCSTQNAHPRLSESRQPNFLLLAWHRDGTVRRPTRRTHRLTNERRNPRPGLFKSSAAELFRGVPQGTSRSV
jgi:hypothetical protein